MSPSPSFAVTYTIKNEARCLPDALRWYRALGATRFYIFLDGTTDEMRSWLSTQPDVVVGDSVHPHSVEEPPQWIADLEPSWGHFIDARKNVNSWVAARRAAQEGIEWIAMIDPDELLLPSPDDPPSPEATSQLLAATPARVDQLLIRNCDVLPVPDPPSFFGHRFFIDRRPLLESLWRPVRKTLILLPVKPEVVARAEDRFWKTVLRQRNPWNLIDPDSDKPIPTGYFLSYASHKSLLRTKRYTHSRPVIHHWVRPSGRRRSRVHTSARLLHYDLPDAEHFVHKFSQRRGQREFSPRHFYVRRRLTEIAAGRTIDDARQYFDRQIAMGDPKRIEELLDAGVLLDLPIVASFFEGGRPT